LPTGISVYLPIFIKSEKEDQTVAEPDLLAQATGATPPIPRVTEEVKWNISESAADTSIFDRVDNLIELPVDKMIKLIRNEHIAGTPEQRDRADNFDEL
jgi:hypothetical protein